MLRYCLSALRGFLFFVCVLLACSAATQAAQADSQDLLSEALRTSEQLTDTLRTFQAAARADDGGIASECAFDAATGAPSLEAMAACLPAEERAQYETDEFVQTDAPWATAGASHADALQTVTMCHKQREVWSLSIVCCGRHDGAQHFATAANFCTCIAQCPASTGCTRNDDCDAQPGQNESEPAL